MQRRLTPTRSSTSSRELQGTRSSSRGPRTDVIAATVVAREVTTREMATMTSDELLSQHMPMMTPLEATLLSNYQENIPLVQPCGDTTEAGAAEPAHRDLVEDDQDDDDDELLLMELPPEATRVADFDPNITLVEPEPDWVWAQNDEQAAAAEQADEAAGAHEEGADHPEEAAGLLPEAADHPEEAAAVDHEEAAGHPEEAPGPLVHMRSGCYDWEIENANLLITHISSKKRKAATRLKNMNEESREALRTSMVVAAGDPSNCVMIKKHPLRPSSVIGECQMCGGSLDAPEHWAPHVMACTGRVSAMMQHMAFLLDDFKKPQRTMSS